MATVVALDIGGTSVKSGCITPGWAGGRADDEVHVTPIAHDAPADELVTRLAAAVREVAPAGEMVLRIAAAVPDPFDHASGVSLMTHKFAALYGQPLEPLIGQALARPIEIRWCNDAAAAVAGEAAGGAGTGHRRVLGITLGTGLGVALVADGVVIPRAGDTVLGDLWRAVLPGGGTADHAFAARTLQAGDGAEFGRRLGAFLAPVAAAGHADVLVVGGGGAGSFEQIADTLRAGVGIPVARAALGPWAALVGAVQLCYPARLRETG